MNIEIANRLVKLRKANGYSQEELADKLGLSRQAVSKWERAEASPDTDNLICLANLYGITLDELLNADVPVEELKENQKAATEDAEEEEELEDEEEDEDEIEEEQWSQTKPRLTHAIRIVSAVGYITAAAVYLLLGFFWQHNGPVGWAMGWVVFLLPEIVTSFLRAIRAKNANLFNISVLIVFFYVGCGILGFYYGFSSWHPYWVAFFIIPIYYTVVNVVRRNN